MLDVRDEKKPSSLTSEPIADERRRKRKKRGSVDDPSGHRERCAW
jgi:hypothetical protein